VLLNIGLSESCGDREGGCKRLDRGVKAKDLYLELDQKLASVETEGL
jgi:hypothetical protein